jgi:hypothetical protein
LKLFAPPAACIFTQSSTSVTLSEAKDRRKARARSGACELSASQVPRLARGEKAHVQFLPAKHMGIFRFAQDDSSSAKRLGIQLKSQL